MSETAADFCFVLDAMRADEERGAYPELAVHIQLYEATILGHGDEAIKEAYKAIKARIEAGFEYEKAHGKWSLLKRDHPYAVELEKYGFRRKGGSTTKRLRLG